MLTLLIGTILLHRLHSFLLIIPSQRTAHNFFYLVAVLDFVGYQMLYIEYNWTIRSRQLFAHASASIAQLTARRTEKQRKE